MRVSIKLNFSSSLTLTPMSPKGEIPRILRVGTLPFRGVGGVSAGEVTFWTPLFLPFNVI